jgi:hypothetical protein
MSQTWGWPNWLNFVIAIIAAILAIILYFFYFSHRSAVVTHGIAVRIQEGVKTGATDSMITGGNNLYIAQSDQAITVTVEPNDDNQTGRYITIKNASSDTVTLAQGTGVELDTGGLTLTVAAGETAQFISLNSKNKFLRLY